jgi:hypothetical protein
MTTITVREFLDGEPLHYRGFDVRKKMTAVYQTGVGVIITDSKGREVGVADVVQDDEAAKRVYWNLKRNSGE